MTCDPSELARLSRCWCLTADRQRGAVLYLLCEWLQKKVTPPSDQFSYTPASAVIYWTDSGAGHNGDLSAFNATADVATVNSLSMSGMGITSISNLSSLPMLDSLQCSLNLLTTLDVSGCPLLTYLDCPSNLLTTLDVSSNAALAVLACGLNPLTTLYVTGCLVLGDLSAIQCTMSVASVNAALIACDVTGLNNGSIDVSGQIPAAAPSGAGIVSKNNLLAVGRGPWTVSTD